MHSLKFHSEDMKEYKTESYSTCEYSLSLKQESVIVLVQ